MLKKLMSGLAALALAGCATVTPQDYSRETPVLDLKEYFNGKVDAWGMVQDRSGKVVKRIAQQTGNGSPPFRLQGEIGQQLKFHHQPRRMQFNRALAGFFHHLGVLAAHVRHALGSDRHTRQGEVEFREDLPGANAQAVLEGHRVRAGSKDKVIEVRNG